MSFYGHGNYFNVVFIKVFKINLHWCKFLFTLMCFRFTIIILLTYFNLGESVVVGNGIYIACLGINQIDEMVWAKKIKIKLIYLELLVR